MKFLSRRKFIFFGFVGTSVASIGSMVLFDEKTIKINSNVKEYIKMVILDNKSIPIKIEKEFNFFDQILVDGYFINKNDFVRKNINDY